jgi:hypothetical protein
MRRAARVHLSSIPALMALALSAGVALADEPPRATWGASPAPSIPMEEAAPAPPVTGPSSAVVDAAPIPLPAAPALVVPVEAPPAPADPVVAHAPSLADLAPGPPLPTPRASPADRSASSPGPRLRMIGMVMDVGLPDGAGLGLSIRPVEWLRVTGAATHNTMAPGARLGVTLDPMPTPVAITLTVEGGHYWSGTVPGIQGSPSVAYNYANFHAGLEFGNRSSFRFFLHGGASWLDLNASASQSALASLSNLTYRGWMAPSAKLGFSLHF